MGVLSKTAEKQFRKAQGRAHVPEWWRPASYVAGGIAVAALALTFIFSDGPQEPSAIPGTDTGIGAMEPVDLNPGPVQGSPDQGGTTAAPGGKTITVPMQTGGVQQVSLDAMLAAQRAVKGLFTGSFSGVQAKSGSVLPVVAATWPNAQVGNVLYAVVLPDGSIQASFPVDPDGSGPETSRTVDALVVNEQGVWVYQP